MSDDCDCGWEDLPGLEAMAASAAGCVADVRGCWKFSRAKPGPLVVCRVTWFNDCIDCNVFLCCCAGDAGVSGGLAGAKRVLAGAVTCRLTGRVDRAVTVGDAGDPSDDQEAGARAAATPAELPPAEANPVEGYPGEASDRWACAGVEGGPPALAVPLVTDRCAGTIEAGADHAGAEVRC